MEDKISIIMGIFNCEDTLEESIESILSQTYKNWELIMCDDGSSDRTYEIACYYAGKYSDRIKLLKNIDNKGLNYTLNKCLKEVSGLYIARQDGDDISLPDRLVKEIEYLKKYPQYSFVSMGMVLFDKNGNWGSVNNIAKPKLEDFINGNPFCHAPVLIKREAILSVQGYSEGKYLNRVEDYHLWFKLYKNDHIGYNLSEKLYLMRDDENAAKRRSMKNRINESYIRYLVFRESKLPMFKIYKIIIPVLKGFLPNNIYMFLRKYKINNKIEDNNNGC